MEQNYRYDLLTPDTLLKKYVGKTIKVYRYNEHTGVDEEKQAEVLSVEGGVVLKIDGQVTSNFAGRYAFPEVPENLVQKPTLVWLLASAAADQRVEVTYLTQGLDWHADYVLSIDADDKLGDLNGWVTLKNETGTSYKNAELKLVAGDVQRIAPGQPPMMMDMAAPMASAAAPPPQFKEEGLFEYHLYTLDRPTSLLDKEQKQVSLLSAANIALDKKLIFFGQAVLVSRQRRAGRQKSEGRRVPGSAEQRAEPPGHAAAQGHGARLQIRQERPEAVHRRRYDRPHAARRERSASSWAKRSTSWPIARRRHFRCSVRARARARGRSSCAITRTAQRASR